MNATTTARTHRDPLAIAAGVLLLLVGCLAGILGGWLAADIYGTLHGKAWNGNGFWTYDRFAEVGGVIGLALGALGGYALARRLSRHG